MTTIFPKEQNVTPLFEQILANPTACRRFKDVFLDNLESYQETRGFEKDDTLFAKIILSAYRQSDVSALLLGVCGRTLFELLRQAFLIPKKLTVDNPFFLTDKEGNFIAKKDDISNREQEKFQEIYQSDLHHSETTIFLVDDDDIVHSYEPDFSISTKRINKKRGILVLYSLPNTLKLEMTESEVYAFIWKTFLHIQEIIPSSRIFYGQETSENADELGVFLPIHHFEKKMLQNIEQVNELVDALREQMVNKQDKKDEKSWQDLDKFQNQSGWGCYLHWLADLWMLTLTLKEARYSLMRRLGIYFYLELIFQRGTGLSLFNIFGRLSLLRSESHYLK